MKDVAFQQCINIRCGSSYDIGQALARCPSCGDLLDVRYRWEALEVPRSLDFFDGRPSRSDGPYSSGVWRFHELLPFAPLESIVSIGEGRTMLRPSAKAAEYAGVKPGSLFLQYEGLNPSGSFKDNGMASAFTHARMIGARKAACASTGNTSASLALFAAECGFIRAIVFVGSGKIAFGKLSQSLEYGAVTLQIEGDFDDAMCRVQEVCARMGIYLVNSLNPFRLEGQKAIMYRVLEGLRWRAPDWIIVPGGNLGNSSAFGKAFTELAELGLIKKMPRLAVINSTGAPTLSELVNRHGLRWNAGDVDNSVIESYYAELDRKGIKARTIASAIEIARPVNLKKCLRALEATDGVARAVSDEEIVDAKAVIGSGGLGCEPASAAALAGLKQLVAEGVVGRGETAVCILTGHLLKDPNLTVNYHSASAEELERNYAPYGIRTAAFANKPIRVPNDTDQIIRALENI